MNDDCGQCPMCGEALIISKNFSMNVAMPNVITWSFNTKIWIKAKKNRGIEDGYNREMEFFN